MSLKLLNRGLAVIAQRKALLIFPSTKTEGTATTNGLHLFLFHLVQALFPLSRKKRTMENGRSCSTNRNADSHKLEAEGAIIRIRHKSRAIIRGMFSARARVSTFFVLERMSLQLTILVLYSPPPSNFVPVSFFDGCSASLRVIITFKEVGRTKDGPLFPLGPSAGRGWCLGG